MTKQFQILTTTIITVVLVSCSKETIEKSDPVVKPMEEISTASSSSASRPVIDPLTVNLEGSFQFNGDLKDQTKKLADGIPTSRVVSYTTDRKGNLKSAIYLDSTYGVKVKNVAQQTKTSMSVWIKPAHISVSGLAYISGSDTYGPEMNQISNLLTGGVVMNTTTAGGTANFNSTAWRHLVVTYDGVVVRFYVNGVLADSFNEAGLIPKSLSNYFIGCLPGFNKWKGAIDDLRFYGRTLSATDVEKLYNL
jgi:hypothetical protein